MDRYIHLNRAQLSYDYLHTNSTTHEFLFGAVAELIDNSRDAGSTELDIYTIKDDSLRGGYMLCFADNGCGMLPDETRNVIIFGRSLKKNAIDSSAIGMYGNGLKSGSMRIGNDMILFTKKDETLTCLFLSRTFHEEEKIDEVIVPMPAFHSTDKTPLIDTNENDNKHDLELSIIYKYSPFKCQKDLFSQFDKIKSPSGTIVIIFNMKLLDNGEPEMDITTDPRDVILTHPDLMDNAGVDVDVELVEERRSLRAYISILYADPRMKVYLQARKVQTKRLINNLANRYMYKYASKTFKNRAENDVAKAKDDVKIAELRVKEAESKAKDLEMRYGNNMDADQLRATRKARNIVMDLRETLKQRQNLLVRKQRALKDPKTLTFYFGMNLENRACDGMFVYNCSRLIKMYQRIGPQQDSGMTCRGVVGVVNVPYLVLEPTHNKQDFADAKEFRALMRAMADHVMQYWDDMKMDEKDLYQFWANYGYLSAKWRDPPSQEEAHVRRRAVQVKPCIQCDQCLKWRILPYQQKRLGQDVPDAWQCKDNPDNRHNKCADPEEQLDIPAGVLKRTIKTKEQRQAELEEQIRRKQSELEHVKRVNRDMAASDDRIRQKDSDSSEESDEEFKSGSRKTGKQHRRSNNDVGNKEVKSNRTSGRVRKRIITNGSATESSDEEFLPTKKGKATSSSSSLSTSRYQQHHHSSELLNDVPVSANSLFRPVEVRVQKQIMKGKIMEFKDSRMRIRFDNMPDAIHDRWYSLNSAEVTFKDDFNTQTKDSHNTIECDKALDNFRNALRYFLPPDWPMSKDAIFCLSTPQLANFSMEKFFDQYERGLRQLFASFQTETETLQSQLEHNRLLMKQFLSHITKNESMLHLDSSAIEDQFEEWLKKETS